MKSIFYYIQSFIPWNSDEALMMIQVGRTVPVAYLFDISNARVRNVALAHYACSIVKTGSIRQNQVLDMIDAFGSMPITINQIKKVLQVFDREYTNCLYQPNTCIGILASTSVSESATQNVLNAFHYSGTTSGSQCSMSVGLPRILEILSVTKNQKITNLTLSLCIRVSNTIEFYKHAYCLEHRTLKDFIRSYAIYYGTNPSNFWIPFFKENIGRTSSRFINFTVDLYMDTYGMYKHGLSLHDVCSKIQSAFLDIYCVFSPEKYSTITLMFTEFEGVSDVSYVQFILVTLFKLYMCGIVGLNNVYPTVRNDQYTIKTYGGNLLSAMNHPYINGRTAISNNIWEIYNTLGIEACRGLLIRELKFTFAQSGITANEQHLELLVDVMTHSGIPKPVSRYGVDTDSFIASACFEQSLSMLLNAAINNKTDNTRSESASILLGNPIHTGSGRGIDLFLKESVYNAGPNNNSNNNTEPKFICESFNDDHSISIGSGSWLL